MVEVEQTRTNFDTRFLGGLLTAENKRRVLNRRKRRSRREENSCEEAVFNRVAGVKNFAKKSLTTDGTDGHG